MSEQAIDSGERPGVLARAQKNVLGTPLPRVEGPLKVTGRAPYAYEQAPAGVAYAAVVGAPAGAGRVTAIDDAAALTVPGVVAVLRDDPRMPVGEGNSRAMPARGTDRIFHHGQPVALVVAETQAAAREAAALVHVHVDRAAGRFDMDGEPAQRDHKLGFLPAIDIGDVDAALAAAPVVLDEHYATPVHFPAALEPHASTVWFVGDVLTVRTSNQVIGAARDTIAKAMGLPAERVRVLAPYVGGGFGGKTGVGPEVILAAIAAERLGRPVKVALPRRDTAYLVHHRSATVQHVRIGCDHDGVISAFEHTGTAAQNDDGGFLEPIPFGSLPLYGGANRRFRTDLIRLDLPATGAVRAPGEAIGTFAVECAMDELAERLGLDPIELRRRNEPDRDPTNGKPFSTRRLTDCYDEGARRFGWPDRVPEPGSVRDGEWLIGIGMAAALRGNFTVEASASVRLGADGRAMVSCDMTDIGTGTYTILAQTVAEVLGLDPSQVDVRLGDSDLPRSAGSGGSFGAGSAASAAVLACEDIVAELARRMNASPDELTLADGRASAGGRDASLVELLRGEAIDAIGKSSPGAQAKKTSQASHGAHFAEVAVNAVTGEVRVRRMLGVFDVGRVLNRATAANQLVGGMVWGVSYALGEAAVVDTRSGRFVNPDFGEYHVAVNADVPQIECHFIEEIDDAANQAGAKGVGELGISGAGAAVVNAIYNATGIRVRDVPVTLDTLLAGLPPV
ncbi:MULTISPECIES: xanthine dehydrogenase family protein molybdopterin-binding subunit [Sphingomonas]|jgi:xanthine dehydrogenase YagR molybdenum-binding subunit|uniref:xanthine dehydrogenase family protein molybdopterin-binding subunit n=1 Tax=Sphingomonas TaxID=13687 RepID=UPI000829EFD1|nr:MULTISPECIES: xanthine dehydrogenase family protein molybdopterin-binding subunit [Sphingomonas]MBY0301820.1 xanthine dehydrogenase family protein molybdopterin-binding subunit [Sphingomonas ginsenosidimutans]